MKDVQRKQWEEPEKQLNILRNYSPILKKYNKVYQTCKLEIALEIGFECRRNRLQNLEKSY